MDGSGEARRLDEDHVGLERHHLFRERREPRQPTGRIAVLEMRGAPVHESCPLERLLESGAAVDLLRVGLGVRKQEGDARHPLTGLRARRHGQHRRDFKAGDNLPASHSIPRWRVDDDRSDASSLRPFSLATILDLP